MLEHMLFKPTTTDIAHKRLSSIMTLERDMGATINASTGKDWTNYYATVPTTLLTHLLTIQADQMQNVVLTTKNLTPEQTTVLSEYDMYNSNPYFALECAVSATAYSAHPYRHETIGWRSDIEAYTAEKLEKFYRLHYQPSNATIVIIGDVSCKDALTAVNTAFGAIPNTALPPTPIATEPPQEGIRRTSITRPTTTNLLIVGAKSPALCTPQWLQTLVLLKVLADGPDSILHRALVDTGLVINVDYSLYPTAEPFLATLTCTLADSTSHSSIEAKVRSIIKLLTNETLKHPLKKTTAQILYAEPFARDSSYGIASELTEYVASSDWTQWCQTETLISKISTKDLLAIRDQLFVDHNLTIGTFIGTQNNI
jgi:zinc protease